jgi:uncharacterized protein YndB with AHSA1/START domain
MSARTSAPQDTIAVEIDIAAPPAQVFDALTQASQLAAWWGHEPSVELVACEMEARVGGRWQMRWKPVAGVAQGAAGEQLQRNGLAEYEVHGEILVFEPPVRLVWSWIANWHERPSVPTEVRWDLIPTARGTRLRVEHSGLSLERRVGADYAGGWRGVARLLQAHLEA